MSDVAEGQALPLQLLNPANRADPYPVYAQFRDRGPMQLPETNLTVFSTYRDCDDVLRTRHPPLIGARGQSPSGNTPQGRGRARWHRRDSCSSTRPITPGCAHSLVRRSSRTWLTRYDPTSSRWSTGYWTG